MFHASSIKRAGLFIFLLTVGSCGMQTPVVALSGNHAVRCEAGHPATNPPEIAEWFKKLKDRAGHSCCSEGDGYAAVIDEEAGPGHLGHGHIIDATEKEIWDDKGCLIKTRPALGPPYEFVFTFDKVVPEKFGNPRRHAMVFGGMQYEQGQSVPHLASPPYCVVPLPPSF